MRALELLFLLFCLLFTASSFETPKVGKFKMNGKMCVIIYLNFFHEMEMSAGQFTL